MKTYKYELHLHTRQGSACAICTGAEMVDYYKSQGYSGFLVTDHFINGNTAVDRRLPWAEQMEEFCLGYEDAKRRGDEMDFDVFFGLEFAYRGTEFLILGLDKEWLIANPQICKSKLEKSLKLIRANGGFVVHAHPFRQASYINEIRLLPDLVDAVEVFNAANRDDYWNKQAAKFACKHNLPMTSGADSHKVGDKTAGIEAKRRVRTVAELIDVIKNGECTMIK